jgi:hypothetical protein
MTFFDRNSLIRLHQQIIGNGHSLIFSDFDSLFLQHKYPTNLAGSQKQLLKIEPKMMDTSNPRRTKSTAPTYRISQLFDYSELADRYRCQNHLGNFVADLD